MSHSFRVVLVALSLSIAAVSCASGGDPYKKHERITIESYGVPHSGYYDSHGLWHGGSYDDHHVYHEDAPNWGQRNDPEWSAHFH